MLRYYDMKQQVPKAVVLDLTPSCQQELEEYLCQKAQRSVQLLLPQKGDQMKLLQMAKENASQQIAEQTRLNQPGDFGAGRAGKAAWASSGAKLHRSV